MAATAPIFVGGTGRSGSTIVGHLLDHHPAITLTRPMEVRFITGNDGVLDALAVSQRKFARGRAAAVIAAERILNRWFFRAENVGLHTAIDRDTLQAWVDNYLELFDSDPHTATTVLVHRIMDAVAESIQAARWADTTPANARKADRLHWVYPDARIIVVHRDGRDVAASFVNQSFGPDDVFVALQQWADRTRRIHRAVQASPQGTVLEFDLVDLVVHQRAETVASLMGFLELEPDAVFTEWFDLNVTPAGAHSGRWRKDFDESMQRAIDHDYSRLCDELSSEGIRIPQ